MRRAIGGATSERVSPLRPLGNICCCRSPLASSQTILDSSKLTPSSRKTFNPHAILYGSPALTTTTVERTASTAVPAISSSESIPQHKNERSQAATPSPAAIIKPATKTQTWGKKQVHITGIPDSLDEHRLSLEVDKYVGDLIAFDVTTKEALVSFPVVTAGDMIEAGKVVIAGKVCTVDDNLDPLSNNVVVIDGPSTTEELEWSTAEVKETQPDNTTTSNEAEASINHAEKAGHEVQEGVFIKEESMLNGLDESKHSGARMTSKQQIDEEHPGSLDAMSFDQWRKSAATIGNKYRREQTAEAVEEVPQDQEAPAIGGWDGSCSPAYMREQGLIGSGIADEQIFSLTQTFPW